LRIKYIGLEEKMKVRVRNKRLFGFWCCVFLLVVLNLVFAVNKRFTGSRLSETYKNPGSNQVVFAADKDGSIAFYESKYFKKFIIQCKNDVERVKWEENNQFINIELDKNQVENLKIKAEKAEAAKDISYDNSREKLLIKISKKFNENNSVYVDSNDSKNIIVLIAKEENPFHHIVVLDAGHGGEDKGANLGSLYEKDITLKIVNYAADELMLNGFKVVKTRDEDEFLGLKEISDIANDASGDVFVSVHINSNKLTQYKGVTTYYYDQNGFQKDERIKLANTMQRELVKSDNWEDRGIARDNLAVLRNSQMPSVLLECGFISNIQDRDKLLKDQVLRNFASNISKGIANYFSVE
jgi:N-acetylmuramoyl-L-alanine amidase